MIEYLYNAIRATAGEDTVLAAVVKDDQGTILTDAFHLGLYDGDEKIGEFPGITDGQGTYQFTIPMAITHNLSGRYWYCICDDKHNNYCFKQPIYFV